MALFKKFNKADEVSAHAGVRKSDQRNIRKRIVELYPFLAQEIDVLMPKATPIFLTKTKSHVNLVVCNKLVLFFQTGNGKDALYVPTLRTLHKYPKMMPSVQMDAGAIRFILDGSNVMCRGLTSPGGKMDTELKAGAVVALHVEGKTHAIGVGRMKLSTADIRKVNNGIGVELLHFLRDDLYMKWQTME